MENTEKGISFDPLFGNTNNEPNEIVETNEVPLTEVGPELLVTLSQQVVNKIAAEYAREKRMVIYDAQQKGANLEVSAGHVGAFIDEVINRLSDNREALVEQVMYAYRNK